MPNTYFRFRQFTVNQDKSAMKVCTDACLFGGTIASLIQGSRIDNILDIGTGTGLLSLMIAQACNARIDAVEIDRNAFEQASENFLSSPWKERLSAHHADAKSFDIGVRYDLIISNPPFFENDLLSNDEQRNVALHSTSFGLSDLLQSAKGLLKQDGHLAVLIPYRRMNYFDEAIQNGGFGIERKVKVKQTPKHDYFRCMYWLKQGTVDTCEQEIVIKASGKYTEEFYSYVKDYYL